MFTLTIATDNAAFYGRGALQDEVARILRAAAEMVERGDRYGTLEDYNDELVGDFVLKTDEPAP